jgi:hypothetical protein
VESWISKTRGKVKGATGADQAPEHRSGKSEKVSLPSEITRSVSLLRTSLSSTVATAADAMDWGRQNTSFWIC